MFGLFFSIIVSMFNGSWSSYSTSEAIYRIGNGIGHLFGNLCYLFQSFGLNVHTEGLTDYNEVINTYNGVSSNLSTSVTAGIKEVILESLPDIVGGVIATIVTIGIIVVALKGIKRLFTILFTVGR